MPTYIGRVLRRFHISPHLAYASPAVYIPPRYGGPLQKPTMLYSTSPPRLLLQFATALFLTSIIPVVDYSAAEAEYGPLLLASCEGAMLKSILASLGYPQSSTIIHCDNACAVGIANYAITPCRINSMDMQFHWIHLAYNLQ